MSRYSLKPLRQRSDLFEVAVGWDSGLGTFFVMVFGVADAGRDPAVRHWQGGQPGQIVTVEELRAAIAPYTELPAELEIRLRADQRKVGAPLPQQYSRFVSQLLNR
ncbi:hypothetical protein [Novosphingobium sp. B-7]|jgi:hypothetical protein|uniref:hypothetical protein n=1 Tax=Novosphingobium sp. B-7 TaxID=1298855 RepID=UPI0003B5CF14|nr:hypothetical protein [Novosphingobium sp. B-7]